MQNISAGHPMKTVEKSVGFLAYAQNNYIFQSYYA
jgi:hypothetical protein